MKRTKTEIYTGTDLVEKFTAEINNHGFCEVRPGVFLASHKKISFLIKKAGRGDTLKSFDFKKANFWLTTDDAAAKPLGFNSIKEFFMDWYILTF